MAELKVLGGLHLESASFSQPKPLLLLSYLAVEGSQPRRHLAELFWPGTDSMNRLAVTLSRLRKGAGPVIEADDKRAEVKLGSDVKGLLSALDKSQWQEASDLYGGAFLAGVVVKDSSRELEEWVYDTREYLAERVQYALLNLAEAAAMQQDFAKARELSERAYKLPGLSGIEVSGLKRLYPLLAASSSLLAPNARKELEGYSITIELSREEAKAKFQSTKTLAQLPTRQTSFVGRDLELTEVATLLSNVQLLTLLGTAGVGKTRLALELAHEQQKLGTFEGVYFVALESLTSTELILPTMLSALGLTQQSKTEPLTQLTDFIAQRSVLLVLDNLEHLIDNLDVLSELVQACPNLKLLVTSRERLGLEEEHLFPLGGLAVPSSDATSEHAQTFDAVTLFRERAQQLQPHFELNEHLPAVLRICKLVEGLPLGLELAASWVRLMSCSEIADEIERGLEFLTTTTRNVPERHRSLKAAFDSSWTLLNQKEQDVLRKLSVFRGGFRREAASEVAGATIPILASLVDKSLLRVLPNGRYDQHPLLHQFAQEKLTETTHELQDVEAKLTTYFLRFTENAAGHFQSNSRGHWLQRLDEELANMRVVLNRALLGQDALTGLSLVTDVGDFWITRSLQQEISNYLKTFLKADSSNHSLQYIKGLNLLASILARQGEIDRARNILEEALARGRALGDSNELATTLDYLARLYHFNLADQDLAQSFYEQSIALAEQGNNKARKASCLNALANLVGERGDFANAQTFYEESLGLWRSLGDNSGAAWVLNNLASISDCRRDFNQAGLLLKESLDLFRDLGEKDGVAITLANLGSIKIQQLHYEQATAFLEESLELATTLDDKRLMTYVLVSLGQTAFFQSNYETAYALYTKSHHLYSQLGYTNGVADVLGGLGQLFHQRREWDKAEASYTEAVSLARSSHDLAALTQLACNLALLYLDLGKYGAAHRLLLESLDAAQRINSPGAIALALEGLAVFATLTGELKLAALLWGKADSIRQELQFFRNHIEETRYRSSSKHLRQNLNLFDQAYERGKNLELEQIFELVNAKHFETTGRITTQ